MPTVATPVRADQWSVRTALAQIRKPPQLRRAREDEGLFGPGSAAWEVWEPPTILVATWRAAIVQMFQSPTAAGVSQNSVYQRDPLGRLRRTGDYFMTMVFGDSRSVLESSEMLRRIHKRVTGVDPVTGLPYAANDPENQLWVHYTTWHSVLYCYEQYGPGQLPAAREAEFWRQAQIAADAQGLDPATVPTTRSEVREYFNSMRPHMVFTEEADSVVTWLLSPSNTGLGPIQSALPVAARAAVATLPAYLRELGRLERSPVPARAARVTTALGVRLLAPKTCQRILAAASPEGYAVRHAALYGPRPAHPHARTIADARERAKAAPRTPQRKPAVL